MTDETTIPDVAVDQSAQTGQPIQTAAPVQTPPVDPPHKQLYDQLYKSQLYTKSFDDFEKQFSTPEAQQKLWENLNGAQLYTKGKDDFQKQFFSSDPINPIKTLRDLNKVATTEVPTTTTVLNPTTGDSITEQDKDALAAQTKAKSDYDNQIKTLAKTYGVDEGDFKNTVESFPDINDVSQLVKLTQKAKDNPTDYDLQVTGGKMLQSLGGKENPEIGNYVNHLNYLSQDTNDLNQLRYQIHEGLNTINTAPTDSGTANKKETTQLFENRLGYLFNPVNPEMKKEYYDSGYRTTLGLSPYQYAGLQQLQSFHPDLYNDYLSLLQHDAQPDQQKKDAKEDYEYQRGVEEVKYKLEKMGRENTQQYLSLNMADNNKNIEDIKNDYQNRVNNASSKEEQQQLIAEFNNHPEVVKGLNLQNEKDDLQYRTTEDDTNFPFHKSEYADQVVADALDQAKHGMGSRFLLNVGRTTDNTARWIGNTVINLLGTDEMKMNALAKNIGHSKSMEDLLYQPKSYSGTESPFTISNNMVGAIKNIFSDDRLSDDEKRSKAIQFIKDNSDMIKPNPKAGEHNWTVKAGLNAGLDTIAAILGTVGQTAIMGGGSLANVSKAKNIINTIAPMYAGTQQELYEKNLAEGVEHPYQRSSAQAAILALSALINPPAKVLRGMLIADPVVGKIVAGMDDATIENIIKANSKWTNRWSGFLKGAGKQLGLANLQYGLVAPTAEYAFNRGVMGDNVSLRNSLKDALINTNITMALPILFHGITGARATNISPQQKFSLYEAATDADRRIAIVDDQVKKGQLSPTQGEQIKTVIETAKEELNFINNSNIKILEDKKADLLFNMVRKKALERKLKEANTGLAKSNVEDKIEAVDSEISDLKKPEPTTKTELLKQGNDAIEAAIKSGKIPEMMADIVRKIPEQFFKKVADQSLNKVAPEAGSPREATIKIYGQDIVDIAEKLFPSPKIENNEEASNANAEAQTGQQGQVSQPEGAVETTGTAPSILEDRFYNEDEIAQHEKNIQQKIDDYEDSVEKKYLKEGETSNRESFKKASEEIDKSSPFQANGEMPTTTHKEYWDLIKQRDELQYHNERVLKGVAETVLKNNKEISDDLRNSLIKHYFKIDPENGLITHLASAKDQYNNIKNKLSNESLPKLAQEITRKRLEEKGLDPDAIFSEISGWGKKQQDEFLKENAKIAKNIQVDLLKAIQEKIESPTKTENHALQKFSPSGLLQHTQEGIGETWSGRERVESVQQGNETTGTRTEPTGEAKGQTESTGEEKVTGVKKAISEDTRTQRGLPKVELPTYGKDVEELQKAKERVDGGKSNPRELVDRMLNDKSGYRNHEEVWDMQYYAHQLGAEADRLATEQAKAETPEEKSAISGQIQQLSDEVDRQTEAAQIGSRNWHTVGMAMQPVIDAGFNPSREKLFIKDAYGGEIPKDVQSQMDAAFKERDEAVAKLKELEEKLKDKEAQLKIEGLKKTKTPKGDYKVKRASLIDDLKAAKKEHEDWLKNNGIQSMGIPGFTLTTKMVGIIGKIAKTYIDEGLEKLDDVVNKMYDDLKDHLQGIDKKDIRDAIAAHEASKLSTKATNLEGKVAEGEVKLPVNKLRLKFQNNTEWVKANQRVTDAEYKIKNIKRQAFNSQKNFYQRGLMWAGKLFRASLLSGTNVLYKLASAATIGGALKRIPEQAIGAVYSKIFKGIADKAPIEGGFNAAAEAKFYKEFFNPKKFVKNSWDILRGKESELSRKFGEAQHGEAGKIPLPEKTPKIIKGAVHVIGKTAERGISLPIDLHQVIKDPVKRATFEASFKYGLAWAEAHQLDINDPLIIHSLETAAYKRANYEIFMESNSLNRAIKSKLAEMEKSGNIGATGKFLADFMMPVSTVPTNIARRIITTSPLGIIRGSKMVVDAYRKGIEELSNEQADKVMRQLKQGTLGTALWLIGWYGASKFGGLYSRFNPDKKRLEGELPHDEMEVNGHMIPKPVQHALPFEIMQTAATARHIYDNSVRKGENTPEAIYKAGLGSIGAIVEQVPVLETGAHLIEATKNPYEAEKLKEDAKRRVEPQILKETGVIKDKKKGGSGGGGGAATEALPSETAPAESLPSEK